MIDGYEELDENSKAKRQLMIDGDERCLGSGAQRVCSRNTQGVERYRLTITT